jgi:cysteinyl-tRNA synthetase
MVAKGTYRMTNAQPKIIDLDVSTGSSLRMAFLMTHYRQPMEIGEARRKEAAKVLRRFALACEPCLDGPPPEVVETLAMT